MSRKIFLVLFFLLLLNGTSISQSCSPDSLVITQVRASLTDPAIAIEAQRHQVFYNPDCVPNNKLLLHLVGTFDNPASTTYFPSLAANNGFKAISLKYENGVSGTTACTFRADPDCHWKYHQEVLFGTDTSTHVSVDTTNSIINRVTKLLIHLDITYPTQNWGIYLTSSNEVDWSKVTVSGHSQGGGHMAFLAKTKLVERVITFASPNDYSTFFSNSASWMGTAGVTPDSSYYAFANIYDDVVDFSKQYEGWQDLNMDFPLDSTNVKGQNCPYNNAQILYTTDTTKRNTIKPLHNLVVIDAFTPLNGSQPIFTPVWEYLLGICSQPTSIDKNEISPVQVSVFPNPMNNELTVTSSNTITIIEIINTLGQVVESFEPNSKSYTMNLSVNSGLLFVQVTSEGNVTTITKIVKE